MRVAVVGGGMSAGAIARAVEARGCSVQQLSRTSGFDVLRDDAVLALRDADVVIEATGMFTTSRRQATAFFTASTRAIGTAAKELQMRHILLSIVSCTLPEVQGYGYFAGKTAQEKAARELGADLTIVRSTQWFEFARQNLERLKAGPFALVPQMTIKPVALESVAAVIAEAAIGQRTASVIEVAGPETTTLWRMTRALKNPQAIPIPLPIPGRLGHAFRSGALVPGDEVEVVGPRFDDWHHPEPSPMAR